MTADRLDAGAQWPEQTEPANTQRTEQPEQTQQTQQTEQTELEQPAQTAQTAQAQSEPAQTEQTEQTEQPDRGPADDAPRSEGASSEGAPMPLLDGDELQAVIRHWREIQAEFVDQPRRAMQDADSLVRDLIERVTRKLADEHDLLESRWSNEETVSTEELRQSLQRYRSFFERLLAA